MLSETVQNDYKRLELLITWSVKLTLIYATMHFLTNLFFWLDWRGRRADEICLRELSRAAWGSSQFLRDLFLNKPSSDSRTPTIDNHPASTASARASGPCQPVHQVVSAGSSVYHNQLQRHNLTFRWSISHCVFISVNPGIFKFFICDSGCT